MIVEKIAGIIEWNKQNTIVPPVENHRLEVKAWSIFACVLEKGVYKKAISKNGILKSVDMFSIIVFVTLSFFFIHPFLFV